MATKLEEEVYNELDLLELLGIGRQTLDTLRLEKGFPVVKLTPRVRIYLSDNVLAWLKRRAIMA
uniref:Uncharacterized protein n=1 Tax=viral metagenome TaxID=1070528 RepID=A0A6H2A478_9ZZZZ